jgi:hypothetical protein
MQLFATSKIAAILARCSPLEAGLTAAANHLATRI